MRPGRRALRVDVIGRRLAPASLLRDFHRAHTRTELDLVTLFDAGAAIAAVSSGAIDASFRAVTAPRELPDGIEAVRVLDEPVELLTGPAHELAVARAVTPRQLAGLRPAAYPRMRAGAGLPALAGMAGRQPAPRAHHAARIPRYPGIRARRRRRPDTAVGPARLSRHHRNREAGQSAHRCMIMGHCVLSSRSRVVLRHFRHPLTHDHDLGTF